MSNNSRDRGRGRQEPVPTVAAPSMETIIQWDWDGYMETTDGCSGVEPDGRCEHGYPSWMIELGMI